MNVYCVGIGLLIHVIPDAEVVDTSAGPGPVGGADVCDVSFVKTEPGNNFFMNMAGGQTVSEEKQGKQKTQQHKKMDF